MNKSNSNLTFLGTPLKASGKPVNEGSALPSFTVTGIDMKDFTNDLVKGKTSVILSVPSVDTPVCSLEVKRFNQELATLNNVIVIAVSRDLPFAQKRWCAAEGASAITTGSDYKHRSFGQAFGVELPDMGLLARAVFIADPSGTVRHVEYVTELSKEPDYAAALNAARTCAA